METIELKLLLKLLGFPSYRAPLSKVTPNSKIPAIERERICRKLCDRGLVDYSWEITRFKLAPSGKDLLKLERDDAVTPQEFKILQACEKKVITPGRTGIPAAEAQPVIQHLADKSLIQVDRRDKKIKEVWLTEQGKKYLIEEYEPKGAGNISLTKNLLANYLSFLRQSLSSSSESEVRQTATVLSQEATHKLSDKEILRTIDNLDRKLRTSNYLPIFYLREKLQPPLSREELDQALFRLEKNEQIELSAITRGWRYSEEELNAGIPQRTGSRLFFVTLT